MIMFSKNPSASCSQAECVDETHHFHLLKPEFDLAKLRINLAIIDAGFGIGGVFVIEIINLKRKSNLPPVNH